MRIAEQFPTNLEIHEQDNLPAGAAVDGVYLLTSGIVDQFVVTCVQRLPCIHWVKRDLVANDDLRKNSSVSLNQMSLGGFGLGGGYLVARHSQFVERHDVEPRSLVAGHIEGDSHRVLLELSRKPLIHSQVFVAFQMQELRNREILLTSPRPRPSL